MEHVLEPLYTQQQCIAPIKQLQRKGSDYKLLGKLIRLPQAAPLSEFRWQLTSLTLHNHTQGLTKVHQKCKMAACMVL